MNKLHYIFIVATLNFSCTYTDESESNFFEETMEELDEELNKILEENHFGEITFEEEFGTPDNFEVKHLEGYHLEMPFAFYYGFLKYEAQPDSIMHYIAHSETGLPDISDTIFYPTDTIAVFSNLENAKEEHEPDLTSELDFVEEIRLLKDPEVYMCNKYPKSNILVIDRKNNIIYHHYERYWD